MRLLKIMLVMIMAVLLWNTSIGYAEEAKKASSLILTGRIFNAKLGDYESSATTLIIKTSAKNNATYILKGKLCNELWKNREKMVKLEVTPLNRASYFYGKLAEQVKVIKIIEIENNPINLTEDTLEPNYTIEKKDGKTIIKVKTPEGKDAEVNEDTPVWLE